MNNITEFFHYIAPRIISLSNKLFDTRAEIRYKDREYTPNFASTGDFNIEKLIKQELFRWFPKDFIIAEETASDITRINIGRTWVIDPICGSSNFQNGIKFCCSNLALAENGKLIASCVVDLSREEYIWSVGRSKIFINHKETLPEKKALGRVIDMDLSELTGANEEVIQKHEKIMSFLLRKRKYFLSTYNTSLTFAYTALGRIDAYVSNQSKVWDVAAANYLVMQAGGIVTDMNANPWTLLSTSSLAALDKDLHEELLAISKS